MGYHREAITGEGGIEGEETSEAALDEEGEEAGETKSCFTDQKLARPQTEHALLTMMELKMVK